MYVYYLILGIVVFIQIINKHWLVLGSSFAIPLHFIGLIYGPYLLIPKLRHFSYIFEIAEVDYKNRFVEKKVKKGTKFFKFQEIDL